MTYATSPRELTLGQRVALVIRKHTRVEAEQYDPKTKKTKKTPIGFGAVLPSCDKCPAHNWPRLGCQREGRSFVASTPIRIDYARGEKTPPRWAAVSFCPNSIDPGPFDDGVFLALSLFDDLKDLYPYFGRAIQTLPAPTVAFVRACLGARERLYAERAEKEAS